MPIYDWVCSNCKHEYTYFHMNSTDKNTCPKCASQQAERLVPQGTSFQLKGAGWAKDNYGNKRGPSRKS